MYASLINYYEAIEESSHRMLQAAAQEDWDQVIQLEGVCGVLIKELRAQSRVAQLMPNEKKEKAKIMQRILLNDAQLRCLAEPWLNYIDSSLSKPVSIMLH